jgi:hypothetical protein
MLPEWFALLAPLPPEARPTRRPLVPDEGQPSPETAAIAGWSSLVLELSPGPQGLRVLIVTLDGEGKVLSASDMVHSVVTGQPGKPRLLRQESLGGRFEPDGTFRGTRWHGTATAVEGDAEPDWKLTSGAPEDHEVTRLRQLVADLVGRA